jgi:hypothetical protein
MPSRTESVHTANQHDKAHRSLARSETPSAIDTAACKIVHHSLGRPARTFASLVSLVRSKRNPC